jgi:hypothetical protein
MTMSTETQESKAAEWLKRLREAEAAEETLVEYTRRLGLKLGEAYRWKPQFDGQSACHIVCLLASSASPERLP